MPYIRGVQIGVRHFISINFSHLEPVVAFQEMGLKRWMDDCEFTPFQHYFSYIRAMGG